jgi:hypothetical protein
MTSEIDRKAWIDSLKPGDWVAFELRTLGPTSYEFRRIVEITPKRAKFTFENGYTYSARDARRYFHKPTKEMSIANAYARDLRMVRGFDWADTKHASLVLQVADLIREYRAKEADAAASKMVEEIRENATKPESP